MIYINPKEMKKCGSLEIGDNVCDKYEHRQAYVSGRSGCKLCGLCRDAGGRVSYMGVFGRDEVAEHVIATLDELTGRTQPVPSV